MNESLVIEAVRKTVTVDCAVEEAFHQAVREVVFEGREGGEVYEVSESGERGHWATVLVWEPPARLVLAWNILNAEAEPTEVEVRFLRDGDATRVELEHRGWERLGESGAEKRGNYDSGWDFVLAQYVGGAA